MGLLAADLKNMVYDIFEIDSFKSKMGDDRDIVTLAFSVKEKEAAKDLENFLEKGYDFVLDADATAGEQSDGTYKVFVEMERNSHIPDQIMEIADGVCKLADCEGLKYRYYKDFTSKDLSADAISEEVPLDNNTYDIIVSETSLNNYKDFFNKSYLEESFMTGDVLTLKKVYADPIQFQVLDFGDTVETIKNITERINTDDFAEVIFLSKYLGDYNITKFGNKFSLDNNGSTLVVERLQK
jgi:hypothetical protein|tara:strand:- start:11792 stop:12511 length:720 start_codon:yes stop_codon:yes gene_type:complete